MKLMISVVSVAEAYDAIEGGAEILDIKNPGEGSLGAQPPHIIREIRALSPGNVKVSAAIGDMPNLPGTAALAALGAASCGTDYIKVGMFGPKSETEAVILLKSVRRAVKDIPVSIIAAGYADFDRAGTLDPCFLPGIAASSGMAGCLLDTAIKDGKTVFDFITRERLRDLIEHTHAANLVFGLAGALRAEDLITAQELGADIAGLRTAVCHDNKRSGPLETERIRNLFRRMIAAE